MKLVPVFYVLRSLVQIMCIFSNTLCNCLIAWLQLLETLIISCSTVKCSLVQCRAAQLSVGMSSAVYCSLGQCSTVQFRAEHFLCVSLTCQHIMQYRGNYAHYHSLSPTCSCRAWKNMDSLNSSDPERLNTGAVVIRVTWLFGTLKCKMLTDPV